MGHSDPQESLSVSTVCQAGMGSSQDIAQGAPLGKAGCIEIVQIGP